MGWLPFDRFSAMSNRILIRVFWWECYWNNLRRILSVYLFCVFLILAPDCYCQWYSNHFFQKLPISSMIAVESLPIFWPYYAALSGMSMWLSRTILLIKLAYSLPESNPSLYTYCILSFLSYLVSTAHMNMLELQSTLSPTTILTSFKPIFKVSWNR